VGNGALYTCNGSYNSMVGGNAGDSITTGIKNSGIGYVALAGVTTGDENIGVGSQAGDSITTGSRNTIVGSLSDVSASDGNDQMLFGRGLTGKGDDTFFCGGSNGAYQHNNSSSWSTTSDRRIKKNIVDCTTGLDKINQLRVRNFEYRTEEEITDFDNSSAVKVDKQGLQVGVIAQEIEEVLPDTVEQMSTGAYTVNPDNLTWYLVNAVKELSAENTALKARLDAAGL